MGIVKAISPVKAPKEESPILEELRALDKRRAYNTFLKYHWNDKKKRRRLLNMMKEEGVRVLI